MDVLSNFQYKKLFLPDITEKILENDADIQLYRLENYLKKIIRPVTPYRTTFNFVIFVNKGYIKQYIEGDEYYVEEKGVVFVQQGSITTTLELSDDVEGFYLVYERDILSSQSISNYEASIFLTPPFVTLDSLTYKIITQLLVIMEQELWSNNLNVNNISMAMLNLILIKILNIVSNRQSKPSRRALEISLQFKDLLFKFHKSEKKITFYSKKLFVTENYLNKCVKSTTQKTPKQWLNEVDINYSKALLLYSSGDIAEIAYELNFQTASHFTQLFKKITGLTPKEYKVEFSKKIG